MRAAVTGGGIMGTGIAQVCAEAGFDVVLQSRSRENLETARARIRKNQRDMVEAGLLTEREATAALARLRMTRDLGEAVGDADFVSENIPEDIGLKQAFFRELSRLAKPDAILSTNTSGLSITAIASAVAGPERVVGFHWLNPPHLMVPVEITRGARTSEQTMRATVSIAEDLGRRPVRVERDAPGFLWNRLQMALLREALHIVDKGSRRRRPSTRRYSSGWDSAGRRWGRSASPIWLASRRSAPWPPLSIQSFRPRPRLRRYLKTGSGAAGRAPEPAAASTTTRPAPTRP